MKNKSIYLKISIVTILCVLATFLFSCAKTRTVVFDSNGGSHVETISVKNRKRISEPAKPTKEGFEFVEWQNNGSKFDFSKKIKSDLTLIAVWKKIAKPDPVDGPSSVYIEGEKLKWTAVENATSYLVYVNGVSTEVNALEMTFDVSISEIVFFVTAMVKGVESKSTSCIYRKPLDPAFVQSVSELFELPEDCENEVLALAYAFDKNNLPIETYKNILENQDDYQLIPTICESEHSLGLLEVFLTVTFINSRLESESLIKDSFHKTKYKPASTPAYDTDVVLNEFYSKIIEKNGYTPSESFASYKEDPIFSRFVCFSLMNGIQYESTPRGFLILMIDQCAIDITETTMTLVNDFSETHTFEIQELVNFFNAFYELEEEGNTDLYVYAAEDYRNSLIDEHCSNKHKELYEQMHTSVDQLKTVLSKDSSLILEAINRVYASKDNVEKFKESLAALQTQLGEALSDEVDPQAKLSQFFLDVDTFKDQVIDEILNVLPTEEHCEAVNSIIACMGEELFEAADIPGMEGIDLIANYDFVKALTLFLNFLKSVGPDQYDLDAMLQAVTSGNITDEAFISEVSDLVRDFRDVIISMYEQYEGTSIDFEKIINSSVAPSEIRRLLVNLGIGVSNEKIEKFLSDIFEIVKKYKEIELNNDTLDEFFMIIMDINSMDLEDVAIRLAGLLGPVFTDFTTIDSYEIIKPYIESTILVRNLIDFEGDTIDFELLDSVITDNFDYLKEYVNLRLRIAGAPDNSRRLDALEEVATDKTKASNIAEAYKKLQQVVNPNYVVAKDNFYQLLTDIKLVDKISAARPLISQYKHRLTESEYNLISTFIDADVHWEFPIPDATLLISSYLSDDEKYLVINPTSLPSHIKFVPYAEFVFVTEKDGDDWTTASLTNFGDGTFGIAMTTLNSHVSYYSADDILDAYICLEFKVTRGDSEWRADANLSIMDFVNLE